MSTIYIGFCVKNCAFVAMFIRVSKNVNLFFVFFLNQILPPPLGYREHWSYVQFTFCDFSSSSFPRRNINIQ